MLMSGDRDALRVGRMVEARVRGVSVRFGPCTVRVQCTAERGLGLRVQPLYRFLPLRTASRYAAAGALCAAVTLASDADPPGIQSKPGAPGLQGTAAFCVLPDLAGLDAIVRSEDISSAGPADPRDRVKVGDVIKGR